MPRMKTSVEAAIELGGLVKTYPGGASPAVAGVDLVVGRGSFFGLLGPNGAGKTTLVSMMCGLLAPDAGRVRIAGLDLAASPDEVKGRIGVVPQDLAVYPSLTPAENLEYFGSMMGLGGSRLGGRVDECLRIARLGPYAQKRAETLSGGLKRRLSLVIGLIHEPEILILDEPTVGIDPQSRLFIFDSLKAMNAAGMTIVYTSHYMEEVECLCRDIAIIDQGRIIAHGGLAEILAASGAGTVEIRAQCAPSEALLRRLGEIDGIRQVSCEGSIIRAASAQPTAAMCEMIRLMEEAGAGILSVSHGVSNLEALFISLTGRGLRE
ncbi:MAG: ABC transporter ATP-binding protein [Deltaproteobacteria bacterium]|nr:ABC transporter ATP-binding protein [Deltaproteobacteria bacterium]